MLSYIYKSQKKEDLYLYVEKKDDFSRVPNLLFQSFGEPVFVMELEITLNTRLARENAAEVVEKLQQKGFFVQMPPVRVVGPDKLQ